ncbi:13514_t:CDS:10 [Entrophospora sp. SA101]|nr:13514_t:CDS:10 [Entrophospora sp. SA101]
MNNDRVSTVVKNRRPKVQNGLSIENREKSKSDDGFHHSDSDKDSNHSSHSNMSSSSTTNISSHPLSRNSSVKSDTVARVRPKSSLGMLTEKTKSDSLNLATVAANKQLKADRQAEEARKNRKIADLEISIKSLMKINSELDATNKKQAIEIQDLARRLQIVTLETFASPVVVLKEIVLLILVALVVILGLTLVMVVVLDLTTLTFSTYGFCDTHAKKHRRMAEYYRDKLEKLAQDGIDDRTRTEFLPFLYPFLGLLGSKKRQHVLTREVKEYVPDEQITKKQSTPVSIESFKELNLIFDAVIAEFKKEKEALIDINSKLHTRIEEIWDLVTEVIELDITTRALDDQYEENNARIVKLGQTQNRTINFFNENAEFTKIKDENNELKKVITELEIKKQAKCIQISKELLDEDPIVDYCPSFLNGLNPNRDPKQESKSTQRFKNMGKNKKAGQVFKITNQTQINHNQRGPLRGLTYNLTHDSTYKKYDTNANSSYFEV